MQKKLETNFQGIASSVTGFLGNPPFSKRFGIGVLAPFFSLSFRHSLVVVSESMSTLMTLPVRVVILVMVVECSVVVVSVVDVDGDATDVSRTSGVVRTLERDRVLVDDGEREDAWVYLVCMLRETTSVEP